MAIELDDGTIVRSLPEQVDYLTTANEENEIAIDNLAARLEAAVAGVLHYKGSVATYADLPADAEIGDVYNVIDTGANYAWTGSEWDELGMTVDLSNYYAKNANLTPTSSNTYYLGNSNFTFKYAFIGSSVLFGETGSIEIGKAGNALSFSGATDYRFAASIIPTTSGQNDLGNASLQFRDLYLSRSLKFLGGTQTIEGSVSGFSFNDDLIPAVTETYDLGSSSYAWKDLYLKSTLYLGINKLVSVADDIDLYTNGTRRLSFQNSAVITRTGTYNLGRAANPFGSLYLSGSISDGTNSVKVADIANGLFNVINASDIVSNTLTQAQYDLITNGKPTLISGTFWGVTNGLYMPPYDYGAYLQGIIITGRSIGTYEIIKATKSTNVRYGDNYGLRFADGNLNRLNGKAFPYYPSNTGTFVLKCIDGVLTWVAE